MLDQHFGESHILEKCPRTYLLDLMGETKNYLHTSVMSSISLGRQLRMTP